MVGLVAHRALRTVVAAIVVSVAIVGGMATVRASNSDCDFNPSSERCRAEVRNLNLTNIGGEVTLYVAPGGTYNPNEMFVIQTMWVTTANTGNCPFGVCWVETGYGYGIFDCGPSTVARWYRATGRPTGYTEDCINSVPAPTVGQSRVVRVARTADSGSQSTWSSYIDGTYVGAYGQHNSGTSPGLATGLEANHWATQLTQAGSYNLKYRATGGTWVSGWGSTSTLILGSPPAYGYWGYGIWVTGIN